MESFDVIIVGGGPAGLKCAEALGDSQYSVLLLEKNSEIGPKVCAGGLTGKDLELLELPASLIDFQYRRIRLHIGPLKIALRHETHFVYTIDRGALGRWQLEKVQPYKNITVRTGARVSKMEQDFVIVNGTKIGYRFLVGADGSTSIVKRSLGLRSERPQVAVQYIVPGDRFTELEIFFDPALFSTGYAWIFPHRGYASVGCMGNSKIQSTRSLLQNFRRWLDRKGIDLSGARYEAFVVNWEAPGLRFGNVFLAGDAAGLASRLTGEGIYQALASGEEVGRMILDPGYNSRRVERLLYIKRRQEQLLSFLMGWGRFRWILFYAGGILLKIPRFRKRAIRLLA